MKLTYEQWFEKYKPILNPFTSISEHLTYRFETYGEELEYVKRFKNSKQIWTEIDCENENSYILPGKGIINRSGFYITQFPFENENIEVSNNEMITVGDAKYATIEFLSSINKDLTSEEEDKLHDFYSNLKN